eukprot:Em0001g1362a
MSGRRKKAYSVEFKLSVVSKTETSSIRAVAREAGVDEKRVHEWKGQEMELEEMMQKQGKMRTLHVRVLRRDVARIAKEIITDPHFSASPGWISKFMRRYRFVTSYRVKTTAGQSLPKNVSERIIDYVTNCRKRITRNQLPLNCIANMDETAVWADMPGNSTIEVRGAHTVQIATTGHDKQRITICLAAFADGTKLKPFIVLKEVCELHRPTLRFIPSRARPAFARVLSASLRSVLSDNSEEAWLKLFMLPKDLVNLLSSGKAPTSVSTFLAGGSLTALNKFKPGCLPDVRPIAVGEALRRLTGKCLCSLIKYNASEFFQPLQFGVACASGSEKVVHGLRACMDKHWEDDDFAVVKVDMRNAFNLVSRQVILDECALHFPELLPWATWCYAAHPLLWHPMGRIFSETGVQQVDPLGLLLFALVLQKILNAIDADDDCIHILDDGTLAGKKSAILRALSLLDSIGPSLGIFINVSCFVKATPCRAPIGDYLFCGKYAASKRSEALKLLSRLVEVGTSDPQVALILLHLCGSYCKLIHLARATPPSLVSEALQLFDVENPHLSHTVDLFNKLVSPSEVISVDAITTSPVHQRVLSKKLEDHQFSLLLEASSPADKARLLSVSAPHAASWLLVTPSPGLDLHLDPNELQISIQWWLGIDTARGSSCSLCPGLALDRLDVCGVTSCDPKVIHCTKKGGLANDAHQRLESLMSQPGDDSEKDAS